MARRSSRRSSGLPIDGVLLLAKPAAMTSNRALQIVKRLFRARKAGHTGSLDPGATGMLPLCFGEATKISAFLLDADKTYRVVARLGTATDSGDADGDPVQDAEVPDLDADQWRRLMTGFLGESEQVPPMYSALKHDGKRLYELARRGEVVERKPRRIRIDALELLELRASRLVFRVRCSKGTYVRTLVEDLARAAGTVAFTANLHRERVGEFREEAMRDMRDVERLAAAGVDAVRSALVAMDEALPRWQELELSQADADRFGHGQAVATADARPGFAKVYGPLHRFLGIAEANDHGVVEPKRVFHASEAT